MFQILHVLNLVKFSYHLTFIQYSPNLLAIATRQHEGGNQQTTLGLKSTRKHRGACKGNGSNSKEGLGEEEEEEEEEEVEYEEEGERGNK